MEDKDAIIATQAKRIAELEGIMAHLLAEVQNLQVQLSVRKTSRNSSLPPAQDLTRKNQSRREPSDKKSGGQAGHEGRTLKFSGAPEVVEDLKPNYCPACGADLSGTCVARSEVVRTTHTIEVEIKRQVIEHRHHAVTCGCGHRHQPDFAPPVRYGAVLTALAGYLNTVHYVSFERVTTLFADVLGVNMSQGTVATMLRRCGQAAQPAITAIKQTVEKAPVVGVDETSTRLNGKRGWFWTFQTPTCTYLTFDPSRSRNVLDTQFPNGLPHAIVVSDRYAAYDRLPKKGRQLCLAHLQREINYLEALEKTHWATQFNQWLKDVFQRKPTLELQERLDRLLAQVLTCSTPKTRTFLKSLQKHAQYLVACLYHRDVPPDNNASERAVRHVKSKTKVCGQFKTHAGAQIYADLRSLIDTARKNGQSAWGVFQALATDSFALT